MLASPQRPQARAVMRTLRQTFRLDGYRLRILGILSFTFGLLACSLISAQAPRTSQVTDKDRQFWAFRKLQRPPVPTVGSSARVRTAVDAFIVARLEAKGLVFSADADRITLLRRVHY